MSVRWAYGARVRHGRRLQVCQLGEGNCFLRVPDWHAAQANGHGWFAEFNHLEATVETANAHVGRLSVAYPSGAAAFAGATYDPTSHYRAAAVFDFHAAQGLDAGSSPARSACIRSNCWNMASRRSI